MTISRIVSLALAGSVLASAAFAQGDLQRQPAAPELSKLQAFAGTWKTIAKMSVPGTPVGNFNSTDTYEWQTGKFFLIGHVDFTSPMASGVELAVMGYDREHGVYTYESFNSSGERNTATGTLSGDTWTWSSTSGPLKWRYTEKLSSPTSMSIKFEASQDGSTWSTVMEGMSTKQ